ncbi:hypothetical protein GCM10025859_65270 [Alicyclobacillus fastidiosus]|nr:hypothetical protein GCM10025859_65270 [Alicyclobacillus fastidiosus]
MFHDSYVATTSEYPYLSLNAMNIWFELFGTSPGTSDATQVIPSVDYKLIGLILLFAAVVYASYYIWFSAKDVGETLLKAATMVSLSFYMLATEIHERYIIMALIFSMFTMLRDQRWAWFSIGLTLTSFWDMWTVVYSTTSATADLWMVYLNCVVLIAMFGLSNRDIVDSRRPFRRLSRKPIIVRVCIAVGTLALAVRSFMLLDSQPDWYPWLRFVLIAVGCAATIIILVGPKLGRKIFVGATVTALVAAMAGPLVYNMDNITISGGGSGRMSHFGFRGGGPMGGSVTNRYGNFGQWKNGGNFSPPSGTTPHANGMGGLPRVGNSSQSKSK